jgi:hypothetical protein
MRSLFTIHAGEYLVGQYIEDNYKKLNVWIPSKDTGIDFLVTNKSNTKSISFQVKLSKDYSSSQRKNEIEQEITVGGWLTLRHDKIEQSNADYWVIAILPNERYMKPIYIVITPKELLMKLKAVQENGESKIYHFYPWIKKGKGDRFEFAINGRGLSESEKVIFKSSPRSLIDRDLTDFLGNWQCLKDLSNI